MAAGRGGWRRAGYRFQRWIAPYVFIGPGFLFYMMVTFIPAIIGVYLSFTNYRIISPRYAFVGLANYAKMLDDPLFWTSMKNTFLYASGTIPGVVILSLVLALLVNSKLRGVVFFRTIYYMPVVTPISVAAVIWLWIYDYRGLLNGVLQLFGVGATNWLQTTATAMPSVIVMGIWLAVGTNMIIYLAALKGIPQTYYEAASMDGATPWQQFRYITLPLLSPTTLFVVITVTMGALRVYAEINIMTQGGPVDSTSVIVFYIFEKAFSSLQMGYAAAMSVGLFLVTMALTWINWRFLGRGVHYGG
ncbi:carbohydrate ABC transporter permease [Limnochorda pilosa]|nr:sugar ABC transporter permease [Limnochorda pilosa]